MGKLRVITEGVSVVEFDLAPGEHRVGRTEDNDWCVPHPSVSSHHCVIRVSNGEVRVQDLGSTNGTLLNDRLIDEATLTPGGRFRLGEVEVAYDSGIDPAPAGGGLNLRRKEATPPPLESTPSTSIEERFTPKIRAPAVPVIDLPPGYFASLPGAFAYPFIRGGWLLLVIGTGLFGFIDAAKVIVSVLGFMGVFAFIFLTVFGGGYLFGFLQRIITATAMGDHRLPDWPDFTEFWSDLILPAIQLGITILVPLLPAFVCLWSAPEAFKLAAIPLALLGLVYMPMGFLAVAMLDTVFALNPLLILPSIAKVPLAYAVSCFLLILLFVVPFAIRFAVGFVTLDPVTPALVGGAVSFYFTCVLARVLGLLYYYHREDLGWV
jgi:hypothetical protein